MSVPEPLSIALVSPLGWPAHDDLARRLEAEAASLARRGNAVTILAPSSSAELLADGRRRLAALADGDRAALVASPGSVRVVAVGRALPAGPRRRLGGPLDLAAGLETALSLTPFDVVHLHEPLAPSPALAALRHTSALTAATFHRPERLVGVAFVRPLVERALARVGIRIAASDPARRALAELFPGPCRVMLPGVDPALPGAPPAGERPGLVVIARGADRAGLRFALRVVRGLDLEALGPIAVLGPAEAPWRTRAAVPKVLRGRVEVVPDAGPGARASAFRDKAIALVATEEDLAGGAALDAMAAGIAVLAPRCPQLEELVGHGREGLALPPYQREAWRAAVRELLADEARLAELGGEAARRARSRTWDDVAAELEDLYREGLAQRALGGAPEARQDWIIADLRVRTGPELDADTLVDASLDRGLGAVAVIGADLQGGLEVAARAPSGLRVIVGQEVATAEGDIVGLFLVRPVPAGLTLGAAIAEIHAQGGLVMLPHPSIASPPGGPALQAHRADIDCHEALAGAAATAGAAVAEEAARLAKAFGLTVAAGSGAAVAEDLGAAYVRMLPFDGPADFLRALAGAEPVRRRRGLRAHPPRQRRRPRRP